MKKKISFHQNCQATTLLKCWSNHVAILPKNKSIENLMGHWDLLNFKDEELHSRLYNTKQKRYSVLKK